MSLGDGVFWSTILLVIVFTFYQVSVRQKWKHFAIAAVGLIIISALIGVGLWGWFAYQERPQVASELNDIKLSMTPVDVTLAIGNPSKKGEVSFHDDERSYSMRWLFREGNDSEDYRIVDFVGKTEDNLRVSFICERGTHSEVAGISIFNHEEKVYETLGMPDGTSVSEDGLSKLISYDKWNAAFEIEKKRVRVVCVTDRRVLHYTKEYQPSSLPEGKEKAKM